MAEDKEMKVITEKTPEEKERLLKQALKRDKGGALIRINWKTFNPADSLKERIAKLGEAIENFERFQVTIGNFDN